LIRAQHSTADGGDEPRFAMLETVREYALEQLAAASEEVTLRRRHAAHFLALAETAQEQLRGTDQQRWLARLEREHDNLRAALRWTLQPGETELGVRLAGALWKFWEIRGHVSEGRRWLEELLMCAEFDDAGATVRAAALNGAGALAFDQGDFVRARALHEQCLSLRRALDDQRGMAVSLNNLGNLALAQGDYAQALICYGESLTIKRRLNDQPGMSITLSNMGVTAYEQGDHARALALYEEGLAIKRRLGDRFGIAIALNNLGELAQVRGDVARAVPLFEECLALHRELRNTRGIAIALNNLGHVASTRGDVVRAAALYAESLSVAHAGGDRWEVAFCLEGIAMVLCAQRRPELAARLCGSAAALRAALGAPRPPASQAIYDHVMAAASAALGEPACAAAHAAGQAMDVEAAIAIALEGTSPPAAT
jgi:tetratricopeptide (TPR) repeat protein